MLGQSFLRGIRKKLPWYQSIRVKIVSAHGNSLFLENISDLKEKKRVIRKYGLIVYPEITPNYLGSDYLKTLVGLEAILDFKSDELWYEPINGYYNTLRGNASTLTTRYV